MNAHILPTFGMTILGIVLIAAGISMWHKRAKLQKTGIPVRLRVFRLHEQEHFDQATTYRPEFEIISGQYKGKRWLGKIGTSNPEHQVGDETNGIYEPITGHMESLNTQKSAGSTSILFILTGILVVILTYVFVKQY